MPTKAYTLQTAGMTLATAQSMLREPANFNADQLARARAVAAPTGRACARPRLSAKPQRSHTPDRRAQP